jgi:hypothetical protein
MRLNRVWIYFILLSIVFIAIGEWGKQNINHQIELRETQEGFENLTFQQKILLHEDVQNKGGIAFYLYSTAEFWFNLSPTKLVYLKWLFPGLLAFVFAILEWWFMPYLFPGKNVIRKYIVLYYFLILILTCIFLIPYFVFSSLGFLNVSRKIALLLQSPSYFVLLFFYLKIKGNVVE